MPKISIRYLDGPINTPGAIIADGVSRSIDDLGYLLAVLDPERDQETWDYYYRKWLVLAQQNEREETA